MVAAEITAITRNNARRKKFIKIIMKERGVVCWLVLEDGR